MTPAACEELASAGGYTFFATLNARECWAGELWSPVLRVHAFMPGGPAPAPCLPLASMWSHPSTLLPFFPYAVPYTAGNGISLWSLPRLAESACNLRCSGNSDIPCGGSALQKNLYALRASEALDCLLVGGHVHPMLIVMCAWIIM